MSARQLPQIDLQEFKLDRDARFEVAAELDRAFCDTGFCYIRNTGMPRALRDAAFAASASFHALPAESKQAIAVNEYHRGYIAPRTSLIRTSSVARVSQPNLSESLMIMHEVDMHSDVFGEPLQGPNQWPTEVDGFKEAVLAYNDAMVGISRDLTRLVALALGLDEAYLDPYFTAPTTWLRLLHYPPQPASAPDEAFGAAPHTDYGFMTILAQDDLGGLEVRNRDGEWIAAAPEEDTFVVNVADMLARWTNDRWVSTPHRVRNMSGKPRYSIPFFWDMSMDATVSCLPGCVAENESPRYPPVRFGDYVMERLNKNYRYRGGMSES